jgi:hypothetical protein
MMQYRKEVSMKLATILVVEDERIVATDLQLRLSRLGFSVPETANSGGSVELEPGPGTTFALTFPAA